MQQGASKMCYLFSRSFFSVCKIKLFLNGKKLACCQAFVCRIKIHRTWCLLPALFPVSLNTSSAMAGLTRTLVFQSSISHSNCFLLTGQREQHGHKSKVSWEPLLHEQTGEMYCWRLWNAKEEKDVFTWWHCVYPSKADCRERRCRCTIWRWRMTEHSAEPGWHTNLTARSRQWWRATIRFGATSFSSSVSAFPHSSANKTKLRGRTHFSLPVVITHVLDHLSQCSFYIFGFGYERNTLKKHFDT